MADVQEYKRRWVERHDFTDGESVYAEIPHKRAEHDLYADLFEL